MTHQWCQHHDCWLTSFAYPNPEEPPQFRLFQPVEVVWYDPGQRRERTYRGEVIGLTMAHLPTYRQSGWWYFIRLSDAGGETWIQPGHVDEIHESELRVIP